MNEAAYIRCLDGPTAAIRDSAAAALAGDYAAIPALHDALVEIGEDMSHPFQVGQRYLICTVTLYYVGEVTESSFGFIRLKEASWIHWTGRLGVLLKRKKFSAFPGSRKPRTEPCGDVILALSSVVSAYPWEKGELPTEAAE